MKNFADVCIPALLSLLLLNIGCAPGGGQESSIVRFQLPELSKKQSKVTALAKMNSCYAVDFQGSGIPGSTARTCDPGYGTLYGLYSPGDVVEMSVLKGAQRSLRLYYLETKGECSNFKKIQGLGLFGSNRVHQIGLQKGIDVFGAEVQVNLSVVFPEAANSFDALYKMPEVCRRENINLKSNPYLRMASGSGRSSMSGPGGSGGTLYVRVRDKVIQGVQQNQGVQLIPPNLGESN